MTTLKAVGNPGSWFARIGDEHIPCVWDQWRKGTHYLDPHCTPDKGKWPRFIRGIKQGKVALTRRREVNGRTERDGYLALYRVTNVSARNGALEFDFVEPPIAQLT
jgi:hypothetical protein